LIVASSWRLADCMSAIASSVIGSANAIVDDQ